MLEPNSTHVSLSSEGDLGHRSVKKGVSDTTPHGLDVLIDTAQRWHQPEAMNLAFKNYVENESWFPSHLHCHATS